MCWLNKKFDSGKLYEHVGLFFSFLFVFLHVQSKGPDTLRANIVDVGGCLHLCSISHTLLAVFRSSEQEE